jgi:hypothetical protein
MEKRDEILRALAASIRITARERKQDEVELAKDVIRTLLDLTEPRKAKKKEGRSNG